MLPSQYNGYCILINAIQICTIFVLFFACFSHILLPTLVVYYFVCVLFRWERVCMPSSIQRKKERNFFTVAFGPFQLSLVVFAFTLRTTLHLSGVSSFTFCTTFHLSFALSLAVFALTFRTTFVCTFAQVLKCTWVARRIRKHEPNSPCGRCSRLTC